MVLSFLKIGNAEPVWEKLMMALVRLLEVRDTSPCWQLEHWEELGLGDVNWELLGVAVGGHWLKVLSVNRRKPQVGLVKEEPERRTRRKVIRGDQSHSLQKSSK